jgi:cold shock CspA family protein
MIAKLAAASLDDVAGATAKAGTKAAGVVIDDTAVTPRYVTGLTARARAADHRQDRARQPQEQIAVPAPRGAAAVRLRAVPDHALLMLGGAYLAFEATEKIIEVLSGDHHDADEAGRGRHAAELEARQVKGAIRTDFILSAEIMAIALNELGELASAMQAAALALVAGGGGGGFGGGGGGGGGGFRGGGGGGGGGMPPQVVGEGKGVVKFFNPQKGFGFIVRDDGGEDVFVHISAVEQAGLTDLADGQPLEFTLVDRGGRISATNLDRRRADGGRPQRAARRRGRRAAAAAGPQRQLTGEKARARSSSSTR